jgi:tetratricopeptide (TPR) repeat protein
MTRLDDAGETARAHLSRAQELHTEGRIDEALAEARKAVDLQPDFVDAWMYAGTTLITRKLAFRDGLAALERARDLAPDDPGVIYSLGWCYEFVAYRLEKQATIPYRDPIELYELAAQHLQRCIDLNPEQALLEDAEDLLASIEPRLE